MINKDHFPTSFWLVSTAIHQATVSIGIWVDSYSSFPRGSHNRPTDAIDFEKTDQSGRDECISGTIVSLLSPNKEVDDAYHAQHDSAMMDGVLAIPCCNMSGRRCTGIRYSYCHPPSVLKGHHVVQPGHGKQTEVKEGNYRLAEKNESC